MAKIVLEIEELVQIFQSLGGCPSPVIEGCDNYLCRGYRIEIAAPVCRAYEGEERVVIPFINHVSETKEERYVFFDELSIGNQMQIRQLFPRCMLIHWHTVQ